MLLLFCLLSCFNAKKILFPLLGTEETLSRHFFANFTQTSTEYHLIKICKYFSSGRNMQTKFTKIKYEVHKNYINLRFLPFEIAYHNVLGFKIFYQYTAFFFFIIRHRALLEQTG